MNDQISSSISISKAVVVFTALDLGGAGNCRKQHRRTGMLRVFFSFFCAI